ncbi:MAG: hypothetical protein HYY24_25025 [Verrucomicrobia bacterium]|nr:hypothetical protein [Verrucomicrobiota bacterium]
MNQLLALASVAVALGLSNGQLAAQDQPQQQQRPGRGNFDPEQMRQRMMERVREQLEVKSDDEWKLISERIEKVNQARREVGGGGFGGMGFGRGGRGGPGGGGGGGDQPGGGDQGRRFRGPGGEPSPEAEALQKAIEAKASAEEIKTKLAKYREARKEKEAKLEQAQDELRKVLTVRQEAAAVLAGYLK